MTDGTLFDEPLEEDMSEAELQERQDMRDLRSIPWVPSWELLTDDVKKRLKGTR